VGAYPSVDPVEVQRVRPQRERQAAGVLIVRTDRLSLAVISVMPVIKARHLELKTYQRCILLIPDIGNEIAS